MLSLLLAALSAPVAACPTLATGTPSQLSFDTAQVAIVREGDRTTFSVSINPVGEPQEFALVLPVPEVLEAHEVRTLDPAIFQRLQGYSAPRHVDDAGCPRDSSGDVATDAGDTEGMGVPEGEVEVEAEYRVGEYDVTILSAEESASLYDWLDGRGYHLPEGAEERLAEYLEAGSYFLAAKVAEDAALADGVPLSPLQVAYDSPVFSIPIRLAVLSSPGEQDMVIYALTDDADGRVGIANYPEFSIPDKCIWTHGSGDFGTFYEAEFDEAWGAVEDAAWTVEYAARPGEASPASSVWITAWDVEQLGFSADPRDHFLTRIRMRYTVAQADQDLTLYASGLDDVKVTSFADDNALNRECRERCDGSDVSDGADGADETGGRGCAAAAGTASAGLALGGLLLGLRRRRLTAG